MPEETSFCGSKNLFPQLEKDFWENRKEYDYILQCSPNTEEVSIYKVPSRNMRKVIKSLSYFIFHKKKFY